MKTYPKYVWMLGIIAAYAGMVILNSILSHQINNLTNEDAPIPVSVKKEKPPKDVKASDIAGKNVFRIERKDARQEYPESIIYIEKEEVARYKLKEGRILDVVGNIPDGKVKFVNEWKKTYGTEHFLDGKRHGAYEEYYKKDQLKAEAQYHQGRLLTRKSYYQNGGLRMEEDYKEARFMQMRLTFGELKAAGVGKIYRADGSLKYEWFLIDGAEVGYTRTYDQYGGLVEEKYYDGQGMPIQRPIGSPEPVS